jgi:hypothetical protein
MSIMLYICSIRVGTFLPKVEKTMDKTGKNRPGKNTFLPKWQKWICFIYGDVTILTII